MPKKFIIGIGQRARNGKDTVANYIKELRPNVHILHWADALYNEVKNVDRLYPLIWQINIGKDIYYNLLDTPASRCYKLLKSDEVPFIHDLMASRNLTEYWGMDEKDAPVLQAWGTNFRRQWCDEFYWVNKTYTKAMEIIDNHVLDENLYIVIPDTRFKNEQKRILQNLECLDTDFNGNLFVPPKYKGIFVRVIRYNEDGSQFIDPTRNPNHPSECELEGVIADFTLDAKSGDIETLKQKTILFLNEIDKNW